MTFTTIENFLQYTEEMNGENEHHKLQKEGYAYMIEVGGFYFLAKTVVRYMKRLHEDSWELVGAFGEINPQKK